MDVVSQQEDQLGSLEARFDELFEDQYTAMVRLATILVDSQSVAEELVQDSFQRMWQTFGSVQHPASYLRRSVVNAAHGELRKRRVRRLHPDPLPTTATTESEYLLDVLAALPMRKRTALVLRFYCGLSSAEIAEAMNIATGTVKSTIHRGLADLRKELS